MHLPPLGSPGMNSAAKPRSQKLVKPPATSVQRPARPDSSNFGSKDVVYQVNDLVNQYFDTNSRDVSLLEQAFEIIESSGDEFRQLVETLDSFLDHNPSSTLESGQGHYSSQLQWITEGIKVEIERHYSGSFESFIADQKESFEKFQGDPGTRSLQEKNQTPQDLETRDKQPELAQKREQSAAEQTFNTFLEELKDEELLTFCAHSLRESASEKHETNYSNVSAQWVANILTLARPFCENKEVQAIIDQYLLGLDPSFNEYLQPENTLATEDICEQLANLPDLEESKQFFHVNTGWGGAQAHAMRMLVKWEGDHYTISVCNQWSNNDSTSWIAPAGFFETKEGKQFLTEMMTVYSNDFDSPKGHDFSTKMARKIQHEIPSDHCPPLKYASNACPLPTMKQDIATCSFESLMSPLKQVLSDHPEHFALINFLAAKETNAFLDGKIQNVSSEENETIIKTSLSEVKTALTLIEKDTIDYYQHYQKASTDVMEDTAKALRVSHIAAGAA